MNILRKLSEFYKIAYLSGHFPSVSDLISHKQIFAYYGFLGDKNFGDELVFEASKALFASSILLPVKRRMPLHLAIYASLFTSKISGVIIGGGTLIGPIWDREYYINLTKQGKPVFMHGTGVHKEIQCQAEWTSILRNTVYGGVRGPLSIRNIDRTTEEASIAGDAAFFLFGGSFPQRKPDAKRVLINLGTHSDYAGKQVARREMRKFLDFLIKQKYEVVFLPLHSIDIDLGKNLQMAVPEIQILEVPRNYQEAYIHFQGAGFAMGERLHFTAMAILTGCRFLSINYAAKHEDLLSSVSLSAAGISPDIANVEMMIETFLGKDMIDWPSVKAKLNGFKSFQQEQAIAFVNSRLKC